MILLFAGNPTGLQNPSSGLVSPPLTPSPPSRPTKGPSSLMKYSPNDLPRPCSSNHSQGKHWSDECASALPAGGLGGTETVSVLLFNQPPPPILGCGKAGFLIVVTEVLLLVCHPTRFARRQPIKAWNKSSICWNKRWDMLSLPRQPEPSSGGLLNHAVSLSRLDFWFWSFLD